MANARTLSTTELGTIRYSRASATNSWPLQVSLPPNASDASSTQYRLVINGTSDTPFTTTWRGDLRATTSLPAGTHAYKVYRDGELLHTDQINVQPGEPPQATTKRAGELTERRPSGVTQLGESVNGKAGVRFVYAEETHSTRDVYAIGAGPPVRLERDDSGDFVADGEMRVGVTEIRFRVVPREWMRAEMAAFTRLGWDDSAGERGVLVTWPLEVEIRESLKTAESEVGDGSGVGGGSGGGERQGLGTVLVGIAIVVAGLAMAVVLGGGRESVESGEEEALQISKPIVEPLRRGDAARQVLKHMQSTSL